jgi:hypothetical protein
MLFFRFEYHMLCVLYPFVTYILTPSRIKNECRASFYNYLDESESRLETNAELPFTIIWMSLNLALKRMQSSLLQLSG